MFDLQEIRSAVRWEGCVSRRLFLAYAGALSTVPLLGRQTRANPNPRFKSDPFTLGVASGDSDSQGVVLWTKLAPSPLDPDGGMPAEAAEVRWQLAEDEGFTRVVQSGTTLATPQLGHSVHVDCRGLKPDRWYWYQFQSGDAQSPIGRTRTLPLPTTMPRQVKFAVTSCQNFEQGLFTAYEQMAQDEVDLVLHLGDYIYEYAAGRNGKVRTHLGDEIRSLGDYRVRYSQYREDPLLQEMHASCPWFLTWDDHEVDNNYADDISEEAKVDPADLLIRRANAYQAYYEMMPLSRRSLPKGPDMQLFRRASYGRLADLMILDTRQYRSDQPNGDRRSPLNEATQDRDNTLLGKRQRNWLFQSLIASQSRWNVLAQQVMMATVGRRNRDSELNYSMDQWPGYLYERNQLLKFMADRRVPNPVVLTGDIHSNWANELREDDLIVETEPVAVEFVATSLSSGGNGTDQPRDHERLLADNAPVRFHNAERGYIRCTVTPDSWLSDYVVVDDVLKPGGRCFTRASFAVESGESRIRPN